MDNKEFRIGTSLDASQESSENSETNQEYQEALQENQTGQKSDQENLEESGKSQESSETKFTTPAPPATNTKVNQVSEVRSKKERSYTFVADPETDNILQTIMNEHDCGKGVAVNRLLGHLFTVAEKEPVIKTETVEKLVERELSENEIVVKLDPEQARLIDMIIVKRKDFASAKGHNLSESRETLLKGSFFIKGRLFNHDNEFYTGLSRSDVG